MKTNFLVFAFLLLAGMCYGQSYQRKTPEEKAKRYTDEMAATIDLSEEQRSGIYLINIQVSKQFDSLYASKPEKELQRRVTISILRGRDSAYRTVLRPEQFLQFDDLQREKWQKKKELQSKQGKE